MAAFVALPLRALFKQSGSPMEEGFMLVFPERVLRGDVPNRDFLHLYGPGSLWVLAAVYRLAGTALAVERSVGLVQQLAVIGAVFTLALRWGRRFAVICGVVAAMVTITTVGLAALAWVGGVALALWGLVFALWARQRLAAGGPAAEQAATRLMLVAGGFGGAALLYRPDLVLAVVLGYGAAIWGLPRPQVTRLLAGLVVVAGAGYGVQLAMAGPGRAIEGMLIDPVFNLRGGRRLPAPPSWGHYDGALQSVAQLVTPGWSLPAIAGPKQVVLWFWLLPAAAIGEVVVGARRVRADAGSVAARVLLASALLGLGMLPQAIQRPDTTHLAWVSAVPIGLLPLFVAEVVRGRGAVRRRTVPTVVAAITAVVVLFGVMPFFTVRTWTELTRQTFTQDYFGYDVRRGDRLFYLGSEPITPAAQALVNDLSRRARPGQRLFVGTADLRKTPYSDAYIYYLFPELTPATRYIEMDPGVANAPGSGLAEEVAGADWLVLSHVWDNWSEPNDARKFGPDEPNRVVARRFCRVGSYASKGTTYFLLYRRCR